MKYALLALIFISTICSADTVFVMRTKAIEGASYEWALHTGGQFAVQHITTEPEFVYTHTESAPRIVKVRVIIGDWVSDWSDPALTQVYRPDPPETYQY